MAKQEIFFGINIDTGQSIKTFGDLKKRTKELKNELDGLEVGSKRFNELKTEITRNQATIRRFNRELRDTKSLATRVGQGMTNAFKKVGGVIAGAFAVNAIIDFTKQVSNITAEFEKLKAVLSNTLGSKSEADKAFKNIQDFASRTNFSVLELTNAFVKLANQGFKPTMEEMENLADLANSTGKDFDQLAEAIIDAQVGEFERLKEFGIRAKKEGDQVKFTFKGVEEQVKFTETEIRKYILSLGDLNGVSGSTEKISKTLGGAISNLGDAFDSFLASLGETDSFLGSTIRNVVDLSSGFLKLITPTEKASESLSKQKSELNLLVQRITDANIKESERLKLINELNTVYPGFLENQEAEKVNNEQIRDRLREVNQELINSITLKIQEERIQEKAQEAAEIQTELFDREISSRKLLNELNDEYGNKIDLTTGSLESNVNALRDLLNEKAQIQRFDKQGFPIANKQLKDLQELNRIYGLYTSTQKELVEVEKDVQEEQKRKTELINRLFNGVEPTEAGKSNVEETGKELGSITGDAFKSAFEERANIELELTPSEDGETGLSSFIPKDDGDIEYITTLAQRLDQLSSVYDGVSASASSTSQALMQLASVQEEGGKSQETLIKTSLRLNQALALSNAIVAISEIKKAFAVDLAKGFPANIVAVASTASVLATSLATIASAQSRLKQFQRGGVISGPSHANGGVPVKMANGGMVEAEGGEAIINKKNTALFAPILSAINSYGGNGDKFERGGIVSNGVPNSIVPPSTATSEIIRQIQSINIEPTVSVIEINEAQTRIKEINNNSTL